MANHFESVRSARSSNLATNLQSELASNERTLLLNDYPQDRGIFRQGGVDHLSHLDFFGEPYLQFMQQLKEDDLFLHVGPGDFFAEVDYFSSSLIKTHAKILSNAYYLSNSPEAIKNLQFLEKFKNQSKFSCIDGVKFQDLKQNLKGKVTLIADVFAAGSYDADLMGVFEAASEMLIPGGMFAVVLASVNFESTDGKNISASEVYESLKGYRLVNHTRYDGWVFQRTDEPFAAPKSKVLSFVARNSSKKIFWPIRHYQIS